MKAIILAAGKGTRLNKYTQNLPKGMLSVFNKSILQHQVDAYFRNGISDISIVKGYCADKIQIKGTKTYVNEKYAETNMVESLFCAAAEMNEELIISYADIVFEDRILKKVIDFKEDIGVLVDKDWKRYWELRYGKVDFDTESLTIGDSGQIEELGKSDPNLSDIDGRYVGMIRLSVQGVQAVKGLYQKLKSENITINGRNFQNIFMTDFLNEMILRGTPIFPIPINKGWLEFDTNEDYENTLDWQKNNILIEVFNLKS